FYTIPLAGRAETSHHRPFRRNRTFTGCFNPRWQHLRSVRINPDLTRALVVSRNRPENWSRQIQQNSLQLMAAWLLLM
ncbi:MAG: hypothetical protein WAN14_20200, partial [Candidatus Acidiferrales bacterium]